MSLNLTGMLFDLDGTLIDSAFEICNSANYILRKYGADEYSVEEIRPLIGLPAVEIFETKLRDKNLEDVLSEFRQHLGETGGNPEFIYPGVVDSLVYFNQQNIPLGVATNKPTDLAVKVLTANGLVDFFNLIQGVEGAKPKPAPDLLEIAAEKLRSPIKSTWMVGDSSVDIKASHLAGCFSIGIIHHEDYAQKMVLESPNLIIRSMNELIEVANEFRTKR